jgi:hypothetical protein
MVLPLVTAEFAMPGHKTSGRHAKIYLDSRRESA